METNELKKLIGRECCVIDPRSKKNTYETATIIGINWNFSQMYIGGDCYEHVSYRVQLHKLTIKKARRNQGAEYHRSFDVGVDSIRIE